LDALYLWRGTLHPFDSQLLSVLTPDLNGPLEHHGRAINSPKKHLGITPA
jgi:hypothetical protein